MDRFLDFSARGVGRVIATAITGTLVCMAVALFAVSYTTPYMPAKVAQVTWDFSIALPLVLSFPICFLFASKLRELAIAQYELTLIASQDSLTTCLNRGAFVTLVDAYLRQFEGSRAASGGALLVIDADHFKSVNDRFGHSAGDDALKLIVKAIRTTLRSNDLLGRIGGEEFAVFLPETNPINAQAIAERIRWRVSSADFRPDDRTSLSVSIGGVTFEGAATFDELFASADASMYAAKRQGRNRVEFATAA